MSDSWTGKWTNVKLGPGGNLDGYPFRSMAVWDDKIWALIQNWGMSPPPYKIYSSVDGAVWVEAFSGDLLLELLVFDDKLYALGNTATECQIMDLSSGAPVEVIKWKTAGVTLSTAVSFDTDGDIIRIVGYDRQGDPWEYRTKVWTYADGSISSDYTGDWDVIPISGRATSICFHDWTWFMTIEWPFTQPGSTEAWIRNGIESWSQIDNNDLSCYHDTFYRHTPYGAFISRFRYDRGGVWIDTDTVNQQLFDAVESFRGHLIGVNHGDGKVWSSTSSGNLWIDRGKMFNTSPASDYYVCDWVSFQDQLYGGGGRTGDRGQIWRLDQDTPQWLLTGYYREPTASLLKVDHEFGDTVYIGVYNEGDYPLALWIDDEFSTDDGTLIFAPSAGSFIGVQTPDERDTVYVFGHLGTDKQIELSVDWGVNFTDADDDWGEDKITTMEYLSTNDNDLTITNYEDEDLLRTTSGSASWTKRGDIPGAPLSQVRDGNDIFVGCTAGSANLYLSTDIGQTYAVKGTGLPITVDILDLELA